MTRRLAMVVLVSLVALVAAPFAGAGLEGPRGTFILWQLRVPRVLVGAMAGGTLALAGAVFQALFANPLATPSTVGTVAGATLGALAALVLRPAWLVQGLPAITLAAFAGALGASLLVAAAAARGRARMADVLLVGIAVTLAASALTTGLQFTADVGATFLAARWSLGHLPQVGYDGVLLMAPFVVASAAVLLASTRALQALAAGDEVAHARGVHVARLRAVTLTAASLGVAACVAWCGPIAFVGLIVPHAVRLVLGATQRMVLPASLIAGAAFLVLCDTLARLALPGRELPVGVLTAALGAPTLLLLVMRARAR